MENQVKKEQTFSAISVDSVSPNPYKDSVLSAQIRQSIITKTTYPGKNVANDKQDSLFAAAAFGGEPKVYEKTQTRVAWIDVPLGTTKAQVEAKLAALGDKGRIYQIVSTDIQDCLTDGHRFQIAEGNLLLEDAMNKRTIALKDDDGNLTGEVACDDDGIVLYRALYFSATGQEDIIHNSMGEAIEEEASSDEEVA
jgi:hypothetical protein